MFFKQKDYKKAISKYVRVNLYLKTIIDQFSKKKNDDPAMAMLGQRNKCTLKDDEK